MNDNNIHSGSHLNKIVKKGSWYLFSSIAVKAMAILILPIVTRVLSEHDVGVLDSLESIKMLLPLFISLALDEAYYRFYFNHNKDHNELKKYISTYFWGILIWGFFIVFIANLIGKFYLVKIFNVKFYPFIPLTMIGPLLLQLKTLGEVYLKQNLKAEFVSISEVLTYTVYYAFYLFFLLVPKMGAESKIYAFFISDILSFLIFAFVLFRKRLLSLCFDIKIFLEGLSYSVFLILNQALIWITGLSDRLIIGVLKSFSSTGIYSVGYKLGQAHTMFSESIFKVYKPIMFSMFSDDEVNAVKKLETFIPSYFFVMFWLAFSIAFFAKEIIIILVSKKFFEAYHVVPIVVGAYLLQSYYKPFYNVIAFHRKTWIFLVGSIIQSSSNIILNFIFIPIFDRIAAAWTTLVSFVILFFWLYFWSQKFTKIKVNWFKISINFLFGIILFLLYNFISSLIVYNLFLAIVIKSFLIAVSVVVIVLLGVVEIPDEIRKRFGLK